MRNTTHNKPNDTVRQAMLQRCEEEGHSWDNCCSVLFQIYQVCKWCGEKRPQYIRGDRPQTYK